MIIISQMLNSSVSKTLQALETHDTDYIISTIKSQSDCDYFDINTALTGKSEVKNMLWLISLVKKHSDSGIMIDSPNPDVIEQCISEASGRDVIINSITLEDKYENLISIAKDYNAGIVCLPIKDKHIPQSADERLQNAKSIIDKLKNAGISEDKIYIDVLIEAIATNENAGIVAISTIQKIRANFKNINLIGGLSNVSFGLPNRTMLNSTFLSILMQNGLNSAIADAVQIKDALYATNALLGHDKHCIQYINNNRENNKTGSI